jgi:hypothetical protein
MTKTLLIAFGFISLPLVFTLQGQVTPKSLNSEKDRQFIKDENITWGAQFRIKMNSNPQIYYQDMYFYGKANYIANEFIFTEPQKVTDSVCPACIRVSIDSSLKATDKNNPDITTTRLMTEYNLADNQICSGCPEQKFKDLYYKPLMDILFENAKSGKLKAYIPVNPPDSNLLLTPEQVNSCLVIWDSTVTQQDPDSKKWVLAPTKQEFTSLNTTRFKALQDWRYDKKSHTLGCVTIAICPMRENIDEYGRNIKHPPTPLFWIYMPGFKPE